MAKHEGDRMYDVQSVSNEIPFIAGRHRESRRGNGE